MYFSFIKRIMIELELSLLLSTFSLNYALLHFYQMYLLHPTMEYSMQFDPFLFNINVYKQITNFINNIISIQKTQFQFKHYNFNLQKHDCIILI